MTNQAINHVIWVVTENETKTSLQLRDVKALNPRYEGTEIIFTDKTRINVRDHHNILLAHWNEYLHQVFLITHN